MAGALKEGRAAVSRSAAAAWRGALCAGLPLSGASCGPADRAPAQREEAPSRVDVLRSLPYAATAGPADDGRRGVSATGAAKGRAAGERRLVYSSRRPPVVELIDGTGRTLRRWQDRKARYVVRARALDDGALLWLGTEKLEGAVQDEDRGRYLLRFDPDGTRAWRVRQPFHHDVIPLRGGELLTLAFRYVDVPAVDRRAPVRDDLVVKLDASGRVIESRSLLDALVGAGDRYRFVHVAPKTRRGERYIDLIHANTLQWVDAEASRRSNGVLSPASVLVTSRHQNAVFAIDWSSGKLTWWWGRDELDGPHDAQLLQTGRLLIFDNGLERGWSRVIEVDPRTGAITWEYRGDPPESFFTRSRGACQRLAGGNTLITESGRGRVFEVTPSGEIVWEFFNPHEDPQEHERGTIGRMVELDPELAAKLEGTDGPSDGRP